MRISELLQEAEHVSFNLKDLVPEFRALAKKFQLTLNMGMGYPAINKDGIWFAASLTPLKGISDEDAVLSIGKRRIGFLHALAKRLEALMAEGRTVKVAKGISRSSNAQIAEPGQVKDLLIQSMVAVHNPGLRLAAADHQPSVSWFVSNPVGAVSVPFVRLMVYLADPMIGLFGEYVAFQLPDDEQLQKKFMSWAKKVGEKRKWVGGQYKTAPEYRQLAADLVMKMQELGGNYTKNQQQRGARNITREEAIRMSPHLEFKKVHSIGRDQSLVELEPLLPVFRKHGLQV